MYLDIHLADLAMAAEARAATPGTMIRVHIVSDYPADPLTGWPAETTRVTIRLPDRFATYAAEAYRRIQALIEVGEYFEIPSADKAPLEFTPDLIREIVVWEALGNWS